MDQVRLSILTQLGHYDHDQSYVVAESIRMLKGNHCYGHHNSIQMYMAYIVD